MPLIPPQCLPSDVLSPGGWKILDVSQCRMLPGRVGCNCLVEKALCWLTEILLRTLSSNRHKFYNNNTAGGLESPLGAFIPFDIIKGHSTSCRLNPSDRAQSEQGLQVLL